MLGFLLFTSVAFADIISGLSTTNVSNDVAYTELTLSKPTDSVAGDFLLANVSVNGGSPASITAPSGWTLLERTDNDTNISVVSYWKILGASEPASYTWTINPQTRAVGGLTRYSGVDVGSPIDAVGSSIGRGVVATAPSITTTENNARIIAIFAISTGTNNSPLFNTTTGMTKLYDAKNTPFGPTTMAEDATQVSAGSSGTKSTIVSNGPQRDWVAQQIALRMAQPFPSDGLIAYWKMDGDSIDAFSTHDGADTEITYSSGNGIINNGAGFSSALSSCITIADSPALKPTGNFTINAWVKVPIGKAALIFQTYSQDPNVAGIRVAFASNSVVTLGHNIGPGGTQGIYYIEPSGSYNNDGEWHMITAVYDGTHVYTYIDGSSTPDASVAWSNNPAYSSPNYVRIGCISFSGTVENFGDGSEDELGFWSRVLLASEISQLYNSGAGLPYPF